jgi:hypothetical protein
MGACCGILEAWPGASLQGLHLAHPHQTEIITILLLGGSYFFNASHFHALRIGCQNNPKWLNAIELWIVGKKCNENCQ